MNYYFHYYITEERAGLTIEQFLRQQGYSRQCIIHLKKTPEGILINDIWAYTSHVLVAGELLKLVLSETTSDNIVARSYPLDIVYEDPHLLVINKAPDMPIHPSLHNYDNTLANALAFYFKEQGQAFTYRCINRLDRDTSGLLIVAKNLYSASLLSEQMVQRKIKRTYLALVEGVPPAQGTIAAPIARKEGSAIERCVDERGDTAITHYQTITSIPSGDTMYTLVSLQLETGRTHQIRVHMKHLGHPLLGDSLYHPNANHSNILNRQALHSAKLSFYHPITKELLCFQTELPDDLKPLMKSF